MIIQPIDPQRAERHEEQQRKAQQLLDAARARDNHDAREMGIALGKMTRDHNQAAPQNGAH